MKLKGIHGNALKNKLDKIISEVEFVKQYTNDELEKDKSSEGSNHLQKSFEGSRQVLKCYRRWAFLSLKFYYWRFSQSVFVSLLLIASDFHLPFSISLRRHCQSVCWEYADISCIPVLHLTSNGCWHADILNCLSWFLIFYSYFLFKGILQRGIWWTSKVYCQLGF